LPTKDYIELITEESKVLKQKASMKEMAIGHVPHQDYHTYHQQNKQVNDLLIDAIQANLAVLDRLM